MSDFWEGFFAYPAAAVKPLGIFSFLAGALTGQDLTETTRTPGTSTEQEAAIAKTDLALVGAGILGCIAAPAIYASYKGVGKRRKKKLTDKEMLIGRSLENASSQATGLLMTALAAPAIATASAYILVQKLEDAKIITKGLGDATQGLLTVAAAGPALQGIGQIAGSAFTKAK